LQAAIRTLRPRLEGIARMPESAARPAQPGVDLSRMPPIDPAVDGHVETIVAPTLLAETDGLLRHANGAAGARAIKKRRTSLSAALT
jgi:hypothetical protein